MSEGSASESVLGGSSGLLHTPPEQEDLGSESVAQDDSPLSSTMFTVTLENLLQVLNSFNLCTKYSLMTELTGTSLESIALCATVSKIYNASQINRDVSFDGMVL